MLRRFLALLLCFCLLTPAALAERPRLEDLAVLSQSDPLFDSSAYTYRNRPFRSAACGPAAMFNAFNASMGVTDQQQAADISLDLLRMTTFGNDQVYMDYSLLMYLSTAKPNEYPALAGLLSDWDGRVLFSSDPMSAAEIKALFAQPMDFNRLLIVPNDGINEYETIIDLAWLLYHTGQQDATITIAMLSAGTDKTDGAFRTSAGGHYVSLYIPVCEFCEEGAVYILDSFPRCISGETPGEKYGQAYDFVTITNDSMGLSTFKRTCDVARVSDAILRISPKESLADKLLMTATPDAALKPYEDYLGTMNFSSAGYLMIHSPAAPEG